jgi:hypothetical protein
MKNLENREITSHLHSSVNETIPFDREVRQPGRSGRYIPVNGEFSSREHHVTGSQLRDDRSFTQSLWGRR